MSRLFEIRNVSLEIDGRAIVQDLSLDLPSGRVVGLIGHNGSGKSTLLRMMSGQQKPSHGQIVFDGRAIEAWRPRELARRLAYLPQMPPPTFVMTARELVALGRYPWHGALGRFGRRDRAKVDEAIAATALEPLADRFVETLSGGERQRVWLAMLLAQDADCLLLDEPTSALDIAHQIDVLSLVRRLGRERCVVIVLHDVNMAARFCDEIVALHSGRLIARGTPDLLMRPGELERIYGLPMDVFVHPQTGRVTSYVV